MNNNKLFQAAVGNAFLPTFYLVLAGKKACPSYFDYFSLRICGELKLFRINTIVTISTDNPDSMHGLTPVLNYQVLF
jgi:hypothetical protein